MVKIISVLGAIAGIFLLGVAWEAIRKRKKGNECTICKQPAFDILGSERQDENYCRTHLMEVFQKAFLSYTDRMVVCKPNLERSDTWGMYSYTPMKDFDDFPFTTEDKERVQELLASLDGKHCRCGSTAQVLYIEEIVDGKENPNLSKLQVSKGMPMCLRDAYEKIESPLRGNPHHFDEYGLWVPYHGEGIFVSSYA